MSNQQIPLIVIVGPTASGKSSLALALALEFNGEIISADSRAIYRDLDIGTAKPSKDDQALVQHWGVDLVDPGHLFSAKDFQQYARSVIDDIKSRGKVPFLVGGSGLYIDAVVYDYTFSTTLQSDKRAKLETLTIDELHKYCLKNNVKLPENKNNKRYVINTILREGQVPTRKTKLPPDIYVIGITTDKAVLKERIIQRASQIVSAPVIQEAIQAAKKYGWRNEAMTGNIYRLITPSTTTGDIDDLMQKFVTLDWRLAKRQMTWFRRNEHITWLSAEDAYTYCARILAKLNNS